MQSVREGFLEEVIFIFEGKWGRQQERAELLVTMRVQKLQTALAQPGARESHLSPYAVPSP